MSSKKKDKKSFSKGAGTGKELPVLATAQSFSGQIRPSKTSKWRAAALFALNVLMLLHIAQWLMTGTTLSPIEPSESMFTLSNGAVNAGFIFFALAILATLIFGRFVCGWGCHIVALQDLCAWMLKKVGLKPRPFRSRLLAFVPLLVALYMFVLPTVERYFQKPPEQPLFPAFTNNLITTEYWATFPPIAVAIPFLFICGFLIVYFLGSKGFCTYGCPYGGFFAVADKVAPGRIRVTDACEQCGHCTAVCTSNVIVHKEVKQYGMVVDQRCMKCMDCVSVCPNDALYFGFGKPSLGVAKKEIGKQSLSWTEEIVVALAFAASLYAVWDVYQLVPMLMALGIAAISAFLVYKSVRVFASHDLAFYKYALKSNGKLKTAGWVFLLFSLGWVMLNFHSGVVKYYESKGKAAFEALTIPNELALAESDPSKWISPDDGRRMKSGREALATAARLGLFTNYHSLPKLAWIEYLSGNPEVAVKMLERASGYQTGNERALSLYYRGAILNRLNKPEEALKSLEAALQTSPDLMLAKEEKGEALWRLGRKKEAESAWNEALKDNPRLPIANYMLSGAASARGDFKTAFDFEKKANALTPRNALFNWMVGLRLKNVGMNELAETQFDFAKRLDPTVGIEKQ
ncbi:MAG: tetratricopeptide repeat protein [Pyrinomonadaceae bacterium]